MIRRIDRYIGREFLWPFLLCILGIFVMLNFTLIYELMDYLIVRQVAASIVFQLLLYKIPHMVVIALPVSVLFATLLALGRLTKDSELTVMRMAGLSFTRLLLPILAMGVITAGATFYLNEVVVPESNLRFERAFRRMIFGENPPAMEENVFLEGPDNRYFYIRQVDRGTGVMRDILIYQTQRRQFPILTTAKEARFDGELLILVDGINREFDQEGFVTREQKFQEAAIMTGIGSDRFFGEQRSTSEMSMRELREQIAVFQASGIRVHRYRVEYYLKLTMPLVSLVFILVGAPLSLWSARGGRFFGITAAVLVALGYYVITAIFRSVGSTGMVHPFFAAWAPTVLFMALGGFLLYRAEQV